MPIRPDRAKPGTKKSLIVERSGGPLGVVIAGANVHDVKLLEATIKVIVVDRPDPDSHPQNLCLDKGYDGRTARAAAEAARTSLRFAGRERRSSIGEGKSGTQPGAGSSSARSRGCKSAGRSSSDTTRRRRTILACSSSPAPCSGTGAHTGSARRWRRNLLSRLASPVVRQPVRRASSSNSRADDDKASRQDTRPQGGGDALRRADGVEAGDRLR